MEETRLTATQIGDILVAALEVRAEDKSNLHHRVRYLAKKQYLGDGRTIDNRGTQDFPTSEVYRAALLCEFLAFSIDVKVASTVLKQAEKGFRLNIRNYPVSARRDGGWAFSDWLDTILNGINYGETWWLLVKLGRSGTSHGAGLIGSFAHAEEERVDVDFIFERAAAATVLKINLTTLYGQIRERF